jgi:hypothetical protein
VILSDLPHLLHALRLLAVDMGAHCDEQALVPEKWWERAEATEKELAQLSPEEVETLTMGEETEQRKIADKVPNADELLLDAFDGDLSEVFFNPLNSGLEYPEVERAAFESTVQKKKLQERR